jgi:GTP-binding protein
MKIKSAELAHVVGAAWQLPPGDLPEVALAGRSNVGKSTLLNKLMNRKGLARTSGNPGKTRTLNFYLVNELIHLVDLPGYGYAKVSRWERLAWQKLLEGFLKERRSLNGVLLLVDSRHEAQKSDLQMAQWLQHFGTPMLLVATKVDKLSKNQQTVHLSRLTKTFQMKVLPFSGVSGFGRDQVWQEIQAMAGLDNQGGEKQ